MKRNIKQKFATMISLIVMMVVSFLAAIPSAQAQLTTNDLNSSLTPTDLVNTLLGGGVTISNVTYTGVNHAAGNFSGGTGIIGFESGIILSSGNITSVIGPNVADATTTANGVGGDADLNTLIPGYTTFDAAVLEFDFVPGSSGNITFEYVFGSEEYNEYVNSPFNNVFGFFLNGTNIALIPGTSTPVSINNVNGGNPLGVNANNSAFYINNDISDGGPFINTSLDGLTVVLNVTAAVNAGVAYHLKLAIADAGDSILDSDVFIKAASFTVVPTKAEGRMTGGGSVFNASMRATHGFELNCNASKTPNNLQINWGKGSKFHLESLTSASCSDNPAITPNPPAAGFDTYEGTGTGRYNGMPASAHWKFTDAGEPGKYDTALIHVWSNPTMTGAPVLSVSGNLTNGNHQAHEE